MSDFDKEVPVDLTKIDWEKIPISCNRCGGHVFNYTGGKQGVSDSRPKLEPVIEATKVPEEGPFLCPIGGCDGVADLSPLERAVAILAKGGGDVGEAESADEEVPSPESA